MVSEREHKAALKVLSKYKSEQKDRDIDCLKIDLGKSTKANSELQSSNDHLCSEVKRLMKAGPMWIKRELQEASKELAKLKLEEVSNIKMFARWLLSEGYVIDSEMVKDFSVDSVFDYWTIN